jgi:hypothetical protein
MYWIIGTHTRIGDMSLGPLAPRKNIPALLQGWTEDNSISLAEIATQKRTIIQSVFGMTIRPEFCALEKLMEKFRKFLQTCTLRPGTPTREDAIRDFDMILAIFDGACG